MNACRSIELFTLNAVFGPLSFSPVTAATYGIFPQMARVDNIVFPVAYALIGLQIHTTLGYQPPVGAHADHFGVSVVAGQAVEQLALSSSANSIITHMGYNAPFDKDTWLPLEENAVVIPANTSVGMFGFGAGNFALASTCNLYMVKI